MLKVDPMSLETKTRKLDAAETAVLSLEDLRRIQRADREVIGGGLYDTAIAAGMTAPDFSLLNQDKQTVSLGELLEKGPLVLSFNRGSWCGYCRLELAALEKAREKLAKQGVSIVSIAPQSISANKNLHRELGLSFPILSDPGAKVAALYGLAYRLPEDLQEVYAKTGLDVAALNAATEEAALNIPIPATYLVSNDGQVTYAFFDANYRNRLDPQELLVALN